MSENPEPNNRKVFVIHGRNALARSGLFAFLRAIGLDPIEWSEAIRMTGKGSPYIGDVLDAAFNAAQAVVVLQTPDDVAHLHESLTFPGDPETEAQMQPRPNVLFEAGMALGRDEERTIIVELGQVKSFSDIHGRHVVRLSNDLAPRQELANRLETAGCAVKLVGTDWHKAGDLTPPAPPGGGLPLGRKLPSSTASGLPRFSARYIDNGSRRLGELQVTNLGPGDAFQVDLETDGEFSLVSRGGSNDFPVPRLPQGKSVTVLVDSTRTLGDTRKSYFNLTIKAATADGVAFDVDEFVSGL
ncbi:hypothetical protein ABIE44_003032 [Marmoricola sp. OAE513]|uniref:TIR domain-containing protein n=1 Tax=Marmoricola sp. OAE513 TaxID=2817894 RepID=UPI001AE709F7